MQSQKIPLTHGRQLEIKRGIGRVGVFMPLMGDACYFRSDNNYSLGVIDSRLRGLHFFEPGKR